MQLRRSENIKTGNILDENLRALEIFDGEYSSFGEMAREELYQRIFKQLLKRKNSYIRKHPSMLTKPYNQQFIDNKIQMHIMLMELLVRNFRLNYKQGQHVYCQKLNEINEDLFSLFGKTKPIHLYDVNEDERYILPKRLLDTGDEEPGFEDIPDDELPEIPTNGPLASLKIEEQPRIPTDENIVEILDDAEAASTMLGLKDKILTVQDIPEDPTIKTSKTPSVETRRSVDTTMLSSLSGDFLRGLSQNSETENLSEIFNKAAKPLFGSQDDSTKMIGGKSDAALLISPTEKPLKPKRKKDASDSDTSSMVSSGTRAATKRLRQSQADVHTSAPEPKQVKSSRGKEAKAERQRKFVESLNEMNRKNYADVGRYYDDKSLFTVNLQKRLSGKTYYKDTDSTSSSSKSKQKSEFDFLDPSKAFSLGMQRQRESNEGIDTVDSIAMSLSNDQDSMHTARSTHDIAQLTFGNEAYEEDEGWHEELLPLPMDREESVHMYIPSSKEQRQVLVDEATRRKVFVYKILSNPPNYICGITYSIAKDYISQNYIYLLKTQRGLIELNHFIHFLLYLLKKILQKRKSNMNYNQMELRLHRTMYIKL
jgi:hypothetical protein